DQNTVYLSPAPLYHAAPLRFTMTTHRLGGTTIIMEHFDPTEYLRLVEQHKVTHSQLVPTMFVRMLKLDDTTRDKFDTSSLKCAIHAAAPCPIEVKRKMIDWWGPIIHEYYAGSEGNGFVYCNS
ncbi:MAG: AMP-binding protein, partial [Actinomycetota bacterium]